MRISTKQGCPGLILKLDPTNLIGLARIESSCNFKSIVIYYCHTFDLPHKSAGSETTFILSIAVSSCAITSRSFLRTTKCNVTSNCQGSWKWSMPADCQHCWKSEHRQYIVLTVAMVTPFLIHYYYPFNLKMAVAVTVF